MAVSRPRAIPANKFRFGVVLSGAVNGVNFVFTAPESWRQSPPNFAICVYYNGQRLLLADDYVVSESGGPGTGYDTVSTVVVPKPGDKIWADYIAA
jgi:hypothetical protein